MLDLLVIHQNRPIGDMATLIRENLVSLKIMGV